MVNAVDESTDIKETDIVFDCPHCGKSLAIDYRGAGLTIPCTDCGNHVEVPIPEGMDIVDIDSTEEEQEIRIRNLRKSLAAAENRISELEEELDSVISRREALEAARSHALELQKTIRDSMAGARHALDELTRALSAIEGATRESDD